MLGQKSQQRLRTLILKLQKDKQYKSVKWKNVKKVDLEVVELRLYLIITFNLFNDTSVIDFFCLLYAVIFRSTASDDGYFHNYNDTSEARCQNTLPY